MSDDGAPHRPLHEQARDRPEPWWPPPGGRPDLSSLPRRLLDSGADFVLVTMWNGDRWPPQQGVIAASGFGVEVYNDGYSSIWKVVRPP